MSLSKRISSRSLARGIASRKRIADSWLSLASPPHAPRGVEQHAQVERQRLPALRLRGGREQQDPLWPAVLAHDELLGAQVGDQLALGVAGGHGDVDHLQSGPDGCALAAVPVANAAARAKPDRLAVPCGAEPRTLTCS